MKNKIYENLVEGLLDVLGERFDDADADDGVLLDRVEQLVYDAVKEVYQIDCLDVEEVIEGQQWN